MNAKTKRVFAALAVSVATVVGLSACSFDKATQPFQDARRTENVNSNAADVVTMPDGFSNLTTKCDHGNRLYVAYHADSPYAAITVVQQDPTCK
jgi:hypothetical protein